MKNIKIVNKIIEMNDNIERKRKSVSQNLVPFYTKY